MFQEIPLQRPETPLLDSANKPEELRLLSPSQLPQLARELREYLLYSVGQSGGHFGAGLGVVELTIALHYIFDTPNDRLLWDVGHQAYPHKILTERRDAMLSIRQHQGLAAFPKRDESPYDTFGVGHSSTSISAALGMALANRMQGHDKRAIAVIGDGAMTAGMAFEALNHAGHENANMLVILNDNDMSISRNVGGLSNYFARILSSKTYNSMRDGSKRVLSTIPHAWELAKRTEEHFKGMVAPGTLFEELGFNYIGPIDGHDLDMLIHTLKNMRDLSGPQFLHVVTQKGKGFAPAEQDPIKYHAISKIPPASPPKVVKPKAPTYSNIFGEWICDLAKEDDRAVGITPAMREGSDLVRFSKEYPDRYYDVAIAEQHAVTLAAGLACEGAKPVVAIYSTFLQRAYDQLIHDVAIQKLDVTFAIDRAGLVGEDGPTHAGNYDLSFLRCIPEMVIAAPSDEKETRQLLQTAYEYQGPSAVRYPRGVGPGAAIEKDLQTLPIGKANLSRQGKSIAILSFGVLLGEARKAADLLDATLVDMRFIKPLDIAMIDAMAASHDLIVTIEENAVMGGAGSAVNECLTTLDYRKGLLNLGLPDTYVEHGPRALLLSQCGLDCAGIIESIEKKLDRQIPTSAARVKISS